MVSGGGQGDWGYPPRRPFVLLALYFMVGVLQLTLTAWRPPLPDTRIGFNLALAAVALGRCC